MNENQRKAIDDNSGEIVNIVHSDKEQFFIYLETLKVLSFNDRLIINSESQIERPLHALRILKTKDHGWMGIIEYLIQTGRCDLADKLQTFTAGTDRSNHPNDVKSTPEDLLVTFRQKLADYYVSSYSNVATMFGCHKNVKHVWVPLRMEEKTRNPQQHDSFDHFKLLKRLADCKTSKVALVKGHPGVGKTTLIKKIAYDWAINEIDQFRLVLAVPLRSVGETNDFLELTVDYYANKLQLLPGREKELFEHLNQLGSDLLLCLDGLDEYESLAQSPLRTLFAGAFKQRTTTSSKDTPSPLPYKLVVTSRPYACELVNKEFFPLRFEISPLDKAHLKEFVRLYCETPDGVTKVTEYLKANSKLVIKVPLILTFLCYLADVREEIPTNLTLLYERSLGHMLKREVDKLEEKIDSDGWKESKVIKSTAELAFDGCINSRFEFSQSKQKDCGVTNDSFTCGFLLHIYNFGEESLFAEFPHLSVQEFFAALHFYQLCSANHSTVEKIREKVDKEMTNQISQFRRFFVGICSNEKFEVILDRVFSTVGKIGMSKFEEIVLLNDCAKTELLGRRLDTSLEQFRYSIEAERNYQFSFPDLRWIGWTEQYFIHCCSDVVMPKRCRLLLAQNYHFDIPKLKGQLLSKTEKSDQIDIFLAKGGDSDELTSCLSELIRCLSVLPPISTFVWHWDYGLSDHLEANFVVRYETTTTNTKLRHFTFAYANFLGDELKEFPRPTPDDLVIEKSHKTGEIAWVTVVVKTSLDQGELVKLLMRSAYGIFHSEFAEMILLLDSAKAGHLRRRVDSSLEQFRLSIEEERNCRFSFPDLRWIGGKDQYFIDCCSDVVMQKRCRILLAKLDYPIVFPELKGQLLSKIEKFDQIDIFLAEVRYLAGLTSCLSVLPPISTFVWLLHSNVDLEANFVVKYETTTAKTKLRHFTLSYSSWELDEIRELPRPMPDDLVMEKSHKTGEYSNIAWVTVMVKKSLDQGQLLKFLVRLAYDIFYSDFNYAEVSSKGDADHSSAGSSTENPRCERPFPSRSVLKFTTGVLADVRRKIQKGLKGRKSHGSKNESQ